MLEQGNQMPLVDQNIPLIIVVNNNGKKQSNIGQLPLLQGNYNALGNRYGKQDHCCEKPKK